MRYFAVLGIFVFGCHTKTSQPPRQVGRHGYVRQTSGARGVTGIAVTVTDASSGRQILVGRTDAEGRFDFAVPPGRYAFAATTATGFAFIEDVASDDEPVITLSSQCHRVSGKVTGVLVAPAVVTISRISSHVGDRFVAEVSRRGDAVACLPDGEYSAQVEGQSTSLAVPLTVPTSNSLLFKAYPTSQVENIPKGITLERADLEAFARSLVDIPILGLGEANHGTGDFFAYRGRLSLELARIGKLRSILLEADAVRMLTVDDYVMGENVDIAGAVAGLRFWITDVHEFLAFLAEVRNYNSARAPDQKVHVMGIDAQRLEPPVQHLLAHAQALGISEREAALLTRVAPDHGKAFTTMSPGDRGTLAALLNRLAAPVARSGIATEEVRASIAARSVQYQLDYLNEEGGDELRDQAMANLAAYIVDVSGANQAALWAHDDHIAREATGAAKSLGQYISERFGNSYYPIAFLSYTGSARAWDAGGKIGVIPFDLGPTPRYNVESIIMTAARFPDVAWVRLDTTTGALKQWLATPRYVREFGAAYSPGGTQKLRFFPGGIAAVVVVQNASASHPTPTGVRKVAR